MDTPDDPLSLADWRRRVAEMYAAVRHTPDSPAAWTAWRASRDALFRNHPQSPLSATQRTVFSGLPYAPYEPGWRVQAQLDRDVPPSSHIIELGVDGRLHISLIARLHFIRQGETHTLHLYWINGYGGGLFLPFRDASSGGSTYGGGRYLLDSIKGADLGLSGPNLWLDFNFAYNPSCAYNSRWVCPLAPPDNYLPVCVLAGELAPH